MLASLDLRYVLRELQSLIGARLEKVYQAEGEKRFLFRFKSASLGKCDLLVEPPITLHVTQREIAFPQRPPAFCMFLRKHIQGCSLASVKQLGLERVVLFTFSTSDGPRILVVELFSKGNVILCKEDMTIISALENQAWSARTVRGGVKYEVPVSHDVRSIDVEEFARSLVAENRVKQLAVEWALGGMYAEEAIARTGTPREGAVSPPQINALLAYVRGLFDIPLRPGVQGGRAVPFPFTSLPDDFQEKGSFSEALDAVYIPPVVAPKKDAVRIRAQIIVKDQEKRKKALENEAQDCVRAAEIIYARFGELEGWWREVQKAAAEKRWDAVTRLVAKSPVPATLDLKTKQVTVDL